MQKAMFYQSINALIDWNKVEKTIKKYCPKGHSALERRLYSGLLLFKMPLAVNGLSEVKLEEHASQRATFWKPLPIT